MDVMTISQVPDLDPAQALMGDGMGGMLQEDATVIRLSRRSRVEFVKRCVRATVTSGGAVDVTAKGVHARRKLYWLVDQMRRPAVGWMLAGPNSNGELRVAFYPPDDRAEKMLHVRVGRASISLERDGRVIRQAELEELD